MSITKGGKTVATKTLGRSGSTFRLKIKQKVSGTVKIVVTARGPGGTTTKTTSSVVKR